MKKIIKKTINYLRFKLRKSSYSDKVFCIGFNKTGTTSVGKSFEILGFRNLTFNQKVWDLYLKGKKNKVLKYAAKYDSFDDLPWLKEDMIPLLDKNFPNSKFVYLTRDEQSWKNSYFNWRYKKFGDKPDVEKAWKVYKNHEKFVMNYFKDRSKDEFIILNVSDEKGFKKLANFLGKDTSENCFPHKNKT